MGLKDARDIEVTVGNCDAVHAVDARCEKVEFHLDPTGGAVAAKGD